MRDPERIHRILELVEQLWLKDPDLRLLQLLIYVVGHSQHNDSPQDAFYVEDVVVEKELKRMLFLD